MATIFPNPIPANSIRSLSRTGFWMRLTFILALILSITACGEASKSSEELEPTSYLGVNNTDKNIVSILVNGEGGISGVSAQKIGGEDCCVFLPRKWHSGIMATIKWQLGGTYQLDSKGKKVIEDGVPVVIEGDWKEKTVEVPKYEGKDEEGYLLIYFYPNDVAKVLRSNGYPHRPDYPVPKEYEELFNGVLKQKE